MLNVRQLIDLLKPTRCDPVRNPECRSFEVDLWELSRFVATRLVPLVGIHPFPLNEQMLMAAAVCRVRPTHVFEWGTHIGISARIFHETSKAFRIQSEIHSADLPDDVSHQEHPGMQRGRLVRGIAQVHLHLGDGLEIALAEFERAGSPSRALFFLDGDHAYQSVRRELDAILQRAPDAHILLHDTFWQSEGSGYNTGPHRAIDDVLATHGARFERIEQNLGLPGMTFLWNRGAAARV